MTVTLKSKDGQAIRKLIPLTTLPETAFNNLCSQIRIEEGPKGTVLFKQGDPKNEFVYLLEGTISLQAAGMEMDTITGGSEEARFALAHQIPRKVFAVAKDKIRFIRVNADILNSTTLKQGSVGYEVSDMPDASSGDWMTTLLKSPIFQRLPAANLQKVLTSVEEIEVNAGELVVRQGDPGDYYYIIKKGRCSLTRKPSKNAKEIKLAELKTTDTFGEDSLISGAPRNVNITMLTDGTLLRLGKENFLELIKKPVIQTVSIEQAIKEVEKGAALLDVRTPDSFEHGYLEGSRNIPFFSLRMQLGNLDPAKKVIVVCEDGNTSEAASFLLIRHAFDAAILRGGFNAVPEQHLMAFNRERQSSVPRSSGDTDQETPILFTEDEKQALEEARQIISQLQKQLQTEREKRKTAERDHGESGALKDQASQNELELRKQIEALNRELEAAGKEGRHHRDRLAELEHKLAGSSETLAKTLQESEDLKSELTSKFELLESELERRRVELETALKQSALDKERIEALGETLRDQEKQLRSLNHSLQEKTAKLEKEISAKSVIEANLSRIQKESSKQIAVFGEQADKAKETIAELRQLLDQSRRSSALLEKQKSELAESQSGTIESLVAEKQAFEDEAADLKRLVAQITEEKQRMEAEAGRRVDHLQENLARLEQQFDERNRDLESTRNALRDGENLARELQETIDRTAEKHALDRQELRDSLRNEIARLEDELDGTRRENENVKEILNAAVEERAVLQGEYTSARRELEDLKNSFSESERICLKFRQENEALKAEIERFKLESNAKQASSEQSHRDLLDRCRQSETEILDLRSNLENAGLKEMQATREIAELRALSQSLEQDANDRIAVLESEIQDRTRALESKTEGMQSLQEELNQARQSRKDIQDALDRLSAKHENMLLDSENERNALSDKIEALEGSLKESIRELDEARKIGQASDADYSAMIETINALKANESGLETQIAALTERLRQKDKELESLRDTLTEVRHSAAEESRQKLDEWSLRHEKALLSAENVKSDFREQVEKLERRLAQSMADLDETRRAMNQLTDERDGLDLRKRELEAENASLQQDLENLDEIQERSTELENLAEQQREEIKLLNETHAQRIFEAQERQTQLEGEIAALHAESPRIQERMNEKARDLEALEEKLCAIREENAVLDKRLESFRNGHSEHSESASGLDGLHLEIKKLQEEHQALLDEKKKALNDLATLRKANADLESLVQKLVEQVEQSRADVISDALPSELAMLGAEAEHEVNEIKKRLDQSQKTIERLERELAAERRRTAELEAASCQPFSLNPAFTAVDGDVFEMVEEQTKPKKAEQSPNPPKRGIGKTVAACVLSGAASLAGAFGLLLGTESGRDCLESILRADSAIPFFSQSGHPGSSETDAPGNSPLDEARSFEATRTP